MSPGVRLEDIVGELVGDRGAWCEMEREWVVEATALGLELPSTVVKHRVGCNSFQKEEGRRREGNREGATEGEHNAVQSSHSPKLRHQQQVWTELALFGAGRGKRREI